MKIWYSRHRGADGKQRQVMSTERTVWISTQCPDGRWFQEYSESNDAGRFDIPARHLEAWAHHLVHRHEPAPGEVDQNWAED